MESFQLCLSNSGITQRMPQINGKNLNFEMRKSIIVMGSLNIDQVLYVDKFPKRGETITANNFEKFFGGKGIYFESLEYLLKED